MEIIQTREQIWGIKRERKRGRGREGEERGGGREEDVSTLTDLLAYYTNSVSMLQ